eukprot:6500833-Prymnesium_polylepis.1
MADAAMVDAAIEADVYRRDLGAVRGGWLDSAAPVQDLSHLLSGSTPPSQRILSEGVWDRRQAD